MWFYCMHTQKHYRDRIPTYYRCMQTCTSQLTIVHNLAMVHQKQICETVRDMRGVHLFFICMDILVIQIICIT